MDKDLLRGLSEKEVEIEHLKTTIIALNQKIEVFNYSFVFICVQKMNDMQQDVNNSQNMLSQSELKRADLQQVVKQQSIQIADDALRNKQF